MGGGRAKGIRICIIEEKERTKKERDGTTCKAAAKSREEGGSVNMGKMRAGVESGKGCICAGSHSMPRLFKLAAEVNLIHRRLLFPYRQVAGVGDLIWVVGRPNPSSPPVQRLVSSRRNSHRGEDVR